MEIKRGGPMLAWLTFWRPFLFGMVAGVVLFYVIYWIMGKSGQK